MNQVSVSKPIQIPTSNHEFRSWLKQSDHVDLMELCKDQLQQLYDKAKEAYSEAGIMISRKERINLYVVQKGLFGGMDSKLIASLENIGETLIKKPDKRKKSIDYHLPCSGAVLVKHWKGKRLEVKIVEDGFEYEGRVYKSLSRLAKEIAGYAVSGPIFFGLRTAKREVG